MVFWVSMSFQLVEWALLDPVYIKEISEKMSKFIGLKFLKFNGNKTSHYYWKQKLKLYSVCGGFVRRVYKVTEMNWGKVIESK